MKEMMSFTTERLSAETLDRALSGTHSEIIAMFTEQVSRYLPPSCQQLHTPEAVNNWLNAMEETGTVLRLVGQQHVDQQQHGVGFIFVFPEPDNCYRVGYVLDEACWGKGLATEVMRGLVAYLSNQKQAASFIAGVEPQNQGSVNVLVKLGFHLDYSEQGVDYYKLLT
ncbi:GNAT family N-acetyltransferase [Photobacterium makurazakiensis]|uniref:GNAT family N-acetyltransferase n=1 Tax=Photobacterium makurazakiensis TaxID=2910234 RepID=UPI003D0CF65C